MWHSGLGAKGLQHPHLKVVPVLLQVQDRDHKGELREAKHETAEEFQDMLKKLLKKAMDLKDKHPHWCDGELYISLRFLLQLSCRVTKERSTTLFR